MQNALRTRLTLEPTARPIRLVAGIDVGFEQAGSIARAAIVVLQLPELTPIDCAVAREPTRFPYIPGLLSFREAPVALKALRRLKSAPDALLCDGHGYAHPRRFGLACHLGLITGLPSVGVAKSLLVGSHASPPATRGRWTALLDDGQTIGAVLRTRVGVQPVYVSVGHRLDLATAIALTLACTTRYRLPETTRWAHRLASSPRQTSLRLQRFLKVRA